MVIDVSFKKFSFRFNPDCTGDFSVSSRSQGDLFLQSLAHEDSQWSKEASGASILAEFPAVFSTVLGTADCAPYVIELTDSTPVLSTPYKCAPPNFAIFNSMVNELLEQGVVRPSKSPYASPASLVPKSGGYPIVVDKLKVNSNVVFDSYPMPTIEALEQFGNAVIFCVFDLNSFSTKSLSANSRRVTVFCAPVGLYEFNELSMGISVRYTGRSRVIEELFADLKGRYVFNCLDDLEIYSSYPRSTRPTCVKFCADFRDQDSP